MSFEEKMLLADLYLDEILKCFKVSNFEKKFYLKQKGILKIDIKGENLNFLVEDSGRVLNSLQYVIGLIVNGDYDNYLRIILDCENFRQKRDLYLKELSQKFVEIVLKKGQAITLEPMNPYERRLVHSYVSEYFGVYTKSIGKEPNRSVVIYKEKK